MKKFFAFSVAMTMFVSFNTEMAKANLLEDSRSEDTYIRSVENGQDLCEKVVALVETYQNGEYLWIPISQLSKETLLDFEACMKGQKIFHVELKEHVVKGKTVKDLVISKR